jgi:magnesium transporter
MRTIFVHRDGTTRQVDAVDPVWLAPDAPEVVWVNLDEPTDADRPLLEGVFHFHELAVEDALAARHHPKVESYDQFLYVILHGVGTREHQAGFETRDVDFFLGRNYLVTVHTGDAPSIDAAQEICTKHDGIMSEGPAALLHRIADHMVDRYLPCLDTLEQRLERVETAIFARPRGNPLHDVLRLKSEVASLRRVATPQRDVIGRLARREFPEIPDAMAYRFRDIHDHLVRVADEATSFQDRLTSLLDAYLSTQSNRMNQVMKVLTLIATIFMPLTVVTGMYGMNVALPHWPGGDTGQFWWIVAFMVVTTGGMLWWFRRMDWL